MESAINDLQQMDVDTKACAVPTLLKQIITGDYNKVHTKTAAVKEALGAGERQSYRQMLKK